MTELKRHIAASLLFATAGGFVAADMKLSGSCSGLRSWFSACEQGAQSLGDGDQIFAVSATITNVLGLVFIPSIHNHYAPLGLVKPYERFPTGLSPPSTRT